MSLNIPGITMSLNIPGITMSLNIPGITMSLNIPGITNHSMSNHENLRKSRIFQSVYIPL